jgi:hypothetical protein
VSGRRRDIGLGGSLLVGLAEAREKARALRKLARDGQDPLAARRAERGGSGKLQDLCGIGSQEPCCYLAQRQTPKTMAVDTRDLVFPKLGEQPVNRIGPGDVLKVLMPIWVSKPETARRILQRMRTVIDYATAAGQRSGENPCGLAMLGLPKQTAGDNHIAALGNPPPTSGI